VRNDVSAYRRIGVLPALFAILPAQSPPQLLGTNKLAAITGTLNASIAFCRRVTLPVRFMILTCLAAGIGSLIGAHVTRFVSPELFKLGPPLLLLGLLSFKRLCSGTRLASGWTVVATFYPAARFVRKKFCRIWRHSDSRIPVVIKQVWFSGGICKRLIIPPAAPVLGSGQPKITRRIRE
jgi:Sulfite exporter TauE/SafE